MRRRRSTLTALLPTLLFVVSMALFLIKHAFRLWENGNKRVLYCQFLVITYPLLVMNGRTGVYNQWPKIAPELLTALGRVQDRLIFRHRKWLKRFRITLDCTVWEMTGCTSDTFYHHFNALFEEGMTWLNYGEWQIDHVFPLAAVDPSDVGSILGAFNYQNLRPVWSADNSKKGATVSSPPPVNSSLTRGHPDHLQIVPAHELHILLPITRTDKALV